MKFIIYKVVFFLLIVVGLANTAYCQLRDAKEHRILFVLNGSMSMSKQWGEYRNRFDQASVIITDLVKQMYQHNPDVQFGLRMYGHQTAANENNCRDSRVEVPFTKDNRAQMSLRLIDITPKGKGSLEYAMNECFKNDFKDISRFWYSMIVISDSSRNCSDMECIAGDKMGQLYRTYSIELMSLKSAACYDSVFVVSEEPKVDDAIKFIISQYPEKQSGVVNYEPVQTAVKPIAKTKLSDSIKVSPVTASPTIKDSLINTQAIKSLEAQVAIRKDSKIKSVPEGFGYANIINSDRLYTVVLFIEESGKFRRLEEVFFSGASSKKIKLGVGKYKAAYYVNGSEVARSFKILKEMITDVRMN